ncbi:MAG: flagellar basal body L-ring protein FlgH [Algisphaera sp.]
MSVLLSVSGAATAQELSSSLYETGDAIFADPFAAETIASSATASPGRQTDRRTLSPAIAQASFTAVTSPPPVTFAVHDLLTIIIREDTRTAFSSSLDTQKKSDWKGEVAEFPRLDLSTLLDAHLAPNTFADGKVKMDLNVDRKFKGDGDYVNKQTMSARIQASIIDVKPNGTIVIEARKDVRSDHETYTLVATGVCRVDDITADNTVLSSQLADLFIEKQHTGYLKKASEKGPLTDFFDWLLPN